MPIDPNIYGGGGQAVQPIDPMRTLAQVSTIQNMQLQRQEAQQRIAINEAAEQRLSQSASLEDEKRTRGLQTQKVLQDAFTNSTTPEGEIDINKVTKWLIDNGEGAAVPGIQKTLLEAQTSVAQLRDSGGKNELAARNALGAMAASVDQMTPEHKIAGVQNSLAWLQGFGVLTPNQATDYLNRVRDSPEDLPEMLAAAIKASPEQQDKLNAAPRTPAAPNAQSEDFFLANPDGKGGQNVKGLFVPSPGGGKYMYNGQDVTARVQRVQTERDPLAQELAQTRLAAAQEKARPLNVDEDIVTTVAGNRVVDLSKFSAGDVRDKARDAAHAAGAVPVSGEEMNALTEIDTARQNQQKIIDQVGDFLPKDAVGRPIAAVKTTIEQYLQTDAKKAAFGTWRTAAINSLRATAGSKGLRINESEIAAAIENDIPKLTDTYAAAQQKVANVNAMLDSAEHSITKRDRSKAGAAGGGSGGGKRVYYDINGNKIEK